jgi:2-C-methyl-D-erythritol 4-phosphate cytidylyltransferase/2-C-methyl-D-erythritol 2,4-cyclodiphosphate synthase
VAARIWFVVPAAGESRRLGAPVPKQYLDIAGRTVIEHALDVLLKHAAIAGGIVVIASGDDQWPRLPASLRERVATTTGGAERCHSVLAGLRGLTAADEQDWVLVHDAARPCLAPEDLNRLLEACRDDPVGGLLAVPLADTLKRDDGSSRSAGTVAREGLWRAQTPQMFRRGVLTEALERAIAVGETPGDEAAAIESLGLRPLLLAGSPLNIKITHPTDLAFAAALLRDSTGGETVRIGSGFDVHAFGPGDHVVLGGVRMAHEAGLVAHSDGDVVLHALADALLGAIGAGDIGRHFPDDDPSWRGADSRDLLRRVAGMIAAAGYRVLNCDITVLAQAPRIGPHREAMQANIAADLGLAAGAVSVKATTTEGLGFVGRGEGIAAQASVLLSAAGVVNR